MSYCHGKNKTPSFPVNINVFLLEFPFNELSEYQTAINLAIKSAY